MGYTRKVISKRKVSKSPTFYTRSFRLDLAESFHFHYRNFRIEMSPKEWSSVSWGFFISWINWVLLGKPTVRPEERHIKFFEDSKLSEEIGGGYESVRGGDLEIELQNQTDYIHLHYRGARIEFSLDEFKEFASSVQEADLDLKNNKVYEEAPRRIGLNHIIQVRGRVDRKENKQKFLLDNNFLPEGYEHTRKSVIYDEEKDRWVEQIDVSVKNPLQEKNPGFFSIPGTLALILIRFICRGGSASDNPTYGTYFKDLIRTNVLGENLFQKLKDFKNRKNG